VRKIEQRKTEQKKTEQKKTNLKTNLWKWTITLPYDIISNEYNEHLKNKNNNQEEIKDRVKTMDFYTYFVLRKEINKSNHSWVISLTTEKLKEITGYKDNETLKTRLQFLKKNKFIEYDFINFPAGNKKFEIKIIPFSKNEVERLGWGKQKQFEMLDMELITKAVNLFDTIIMQAKVIRLLYYLKKHYNNTFDSMGIKGYAVKAYSEISKDCCIQMQELNEISTILHENYICEKIKGELVNNKYPKNRYIVNSIIDNKTGERLYSRHYTVRLNKENKDKVIKQKNPIRRKKDKKEKEKDNEK